MRRTWMLIVGMALIAATPAYANADGDKAPAHATKKSAEAPASAKDNPSKAQPATSEGAASAAQVQRLEDLIQAQQEELAAQRKILEEQQKEIDSLRGESGSSMATPDLKAQPNPGPSPTNAPAMSATESSSSTARAAAGTTASKIAARTAAGTRVAAEAPQEPEKKPEDIELAGGKIHLGATFYGDWTYYNDTGFGPQFLTQQNQDGPGNGGFNSFGITRTYLNFIYMPNDVVTLRITPNIYRQVDVSGATGNGSGSQIASSSNGNLGFRLKYAYVDFNTLFKGSETFSKDKVTIGQTTNPLVDWEEGLFGYRYASLVPWNYLSLSSTYTGITLHGPIEVNGKEYLDYHLGVFNTASFHAIETNDKKQVMARLTWYPVGTTSDRTGFGLTFFEDYGYNTKTPDAKSTPLNRIAILGHYQSHSKRYLIAGEYDLGRNAFSTGNLFSGAAPVAGGPFDAFNTLAGTVLSGNQTRQQGYAFFGHAALGHSPFALWGLYHHFQPNTNFTGTDPLDFSRTVGGLSYHVNKYYDIAFGDENFHWLHQSLVAGGDTNGIAIWNLFNF